MSEGLCCESVFFSLQLWETAAAVNNHLKSLQNRDLSHMIATEQMMGTQLLKQLKCFFQRAMNSG